MSNVYQTPGIYVEETNPLAYQIKGVETSVTAFVGNTVMGPLGVPIRISGFEEFRQVFGGLSTESMLGYAVNDYFLNGGSQALILRLAGNGALHAQLSLPCGGAQANTLQLEARYVGHWGNDISVQVQLWGNAKTGIWRWLKRVNEAPRFRIKVYFREQPVEEFTDVSLKQGDSTFLPEILASHSRFIRAVQTDGQWVLPGTLPLANLKPIKAAGGHDGAALCNSEFLGHEEEETGIYALKKGDYFSLLCIPPARRGGDTDPAVYRAALKLCAERRAMLLVDAPSTWTGTSVPEANAFLWNQEHENRNAAVYFPRLIQSDPLQNGREDVFVPCGAVAGVIAATDSNFGVWKPPAGTSALLKGVKGLQPTLSTAMMERMTARGVNCIRSSADSAFALWGARTMSSSEEYKYLSVRRTALYIEESVLNGTGWVCFEENNERLWQKLRLQAEDFLMNMFRAGAFQGNSPDVAYFVKCDRETMTQQEIDSGYCNLLIGFAPLRPAEFIIIKLSNKTLNQ